MIIVLNIPAAGSMGLLAEFFEVPPYRAVIVVLGFGISIKHLVSRVSNFK
jgi:hypothetical protein